MNGNNMKYAIITPTYEGHFQYIPDYLKSFSINTKDPEQVDFIFVIEKDSLKKFQKIIALFSQKLQIKVLLFEDILKAFHIQLTPAKLMEEYGRFTYQTFKKMYAMLYAEYDYYLVLDSESCLLKPTKISDLFEQFFQRPFIAGSKLDPSKRISKDFNCLKKNIDLLLGFDMPYWLLENFMWFYDTKILKQLFTEHGSLAQMAEKISKMNEAKEGDPVIKFGIFEICLYQNYLYKNREKLGYTFYDIDKALQTKLSPEMLSEYTDSFYGRLTGNCGLLEHAVLFLNPKNVKPLADTFVDLGFKIIRCDETTPKNYALQKRFLSIVQPVILAASQEHYFSVKHNKKQLLKIILRQKNITKLKKHTYALTYPILLFLKWLKELFYVIKYSIECFFIFIKCVIKMH